MAEKARTDKEILQRLIVAQEDERSRISRDLHDELGQQLIALRFVLERSKGLVLSDEARDSIDQISQITEAIDKSVDFLAWELRPALLETLGLSDAIENYLRQWSQHASVEAEILTSGWERSSLKSDVESNLYRIVQEALNNTHKHANAKRVDVILEHRGDAVLLIISDDGDGFRMQNKRWRSNGLGVSGMRERAALIGANFEIESSSGRGTSIHVNLPIGRKKKRRSLVAGENTDWG